MWFVVNQALIVNQKNDIGDEFTQEMFIFNMKGCDDVMIFFKVVPYIQAQLLNLALKYFTL